MDPTRPAAGLELLTFRVLCVLGGICLPALGYLYNQANAAAVDPMWLRLVMGGLPVALVAASLISEQVRREIAGLSHVVLVAIVTWFAVLIALNGLAPEYAAGGIATMVAVGVAASAFDRLWVLCASVGFATAALLAPLLVVASPGIDPLIYAGLVAASAACLFFNAWVQHRMRDRLAASEQRYRTVFERVADGVVLISSPELRVIASNDAYRQFTGYSRQELHGRLIYDLVDARRDEVDVDVKRAMQDGRVDLGERRHRTPRRHRRSTWTSGSRGFRTPAATCCA
jgi:PAS domain S-box-containing protein